MANKQVTRGGLRKAKIINLSNESEFVECMFNPHEYSLSKSNTWKANENISKNAPTATFKSGGAQVLKLSLHFDTLEEGGDVRDITDKLWKMMEVDEDNKNSESGKGAPPEVAFEWGRLYFRSVITNMTQKFTLFTADGVPVRCAVNITLEQKVDKGDYKESPLAAITPNKREIKQAVTSIEGDRYDNLLADGDDLAMENLHDMLDASNVDNPLNIPTGSEISTDATNRVERDLRSRI